MDGICANIANVLRTKRLRMHLERRMLLKLREQRESCSTAKTPKTKQQSWKVFSSGKFQQMLTTKMFECWKCRTKKIWLLFATHAKIVHKNHNLVEESFFFGNCELKSYNANKKFIQSVNNRKYSQRYGMDKTKNPLNEAQSKFSARNSQPFCRA